MIMVIRHQDIAQSHLQRMIKENIEERECSIMMDNLYRYEILSVLSDFVVAL